MARRNSSADLLIEIGTEELPAAYLDGAIAQLRDDAARRLDDAHVAHGSVESFGTPRRLVAVIRGVSAAQRHPAEELRGPSKQAAFDSNGTPTPALEGFLRSRGGTPAQLKTVATDKGEYLYLLKPAFTVPSEQVLPELIQRLIMGLRFPKTMRWDDSPVRAARPIRWLLALFGEKPLRVSLGRLASAPRTVVGGPKRPKAVAVRTIPAYLAALNRDGVILDQRLRKQTIERLAASAAAQEKGVVTPEAVSYGLLDEVTHLVERPVSFVGQFDQTYLSLPREVLLASMAKHQRVFAIQEPSGRLLPKFVAITDGAPRKLPAVQRMVEHILNARLADAMLFWEQDRRRSLSVMATHVADVTFHERFGSMADKQARLYKFSPLLEPMWSLSPPELQALRRACELAKADLASTMVKEFPTLQGVMGKHYALAQGEGREVAEAIEEQYLPLAGKAPATVVGCALSVLDKYDTLASYFTAGIEPTGDQDPFGLRRAAQGIVEVAWAMHRPLDLETLFARWQAAAPFAHGKAEAATRIHRYLLERLYTFEWPKPPAPSGARVGPGAPSRDLIDAVLASPCHDLVDAMDRAVSLTTLGRHDALLKAAKVIERTRNILRGAPNVSANGVDPARFQEPLEHRVWEAYGTHKPAIDRLIAAKSYAEATTAYGEAFYEILHEFFDRVMVNVKEEAIQQNRLALLRAINTLYTERIADLSKLAILETGKVTRS